MSATQDLRELADEIDALLTGWPRSRSFMTTETGKKAEAYVRRLREERYRQWSENCALRARVLRLAEDNDGLRATNELLTNELERSVGLHGA